MLCNEQGAIFPDSSMTKKFVSLIQAKYRKEHFIPPEILSRFHDFFMSNNLIVKNADKYAGICIMDKNDYDNEILRQLNDENIYHPSIKSQFSIHIEEFFDKTKSMKIQFNDKYATKLSYLINQQYQPANFYILPKIHKKFDVLISYWKTNQGYV